MAPMTRSRASVSGVPSPHAPTYYAQRAGAGLIVTEGTTVSKQGQGYLWTPGIYTDEQVSMWRHVTEAVHHLGGKIFVQLWHVGRVTNRKLLGEGLEPVSSAARRAANTFCFGELKDGETGPVPADMPQALTVDGIKKVIGEFVTAAQNAMDAGFDGVEIHGANGYLFEQFLNAGFNTRTDSYGGGSMADRLRLTLETVDAVSAAIGARKVGIRVSPFGRQADMHAFDGEEETWLALASALAGRSLAYVHLSDQQNAGILNISDDFLSRFRKCYEGTLIVAGGYTSSRANAVLQAGLVDLVAFGRPYIANPDLDVRMRDGHPLAEFDRNTFYGGGAKGYTDYPPYGNLSPASYQGSRSHETIGSI